MPARALNQLMEPAPGWERGEGCAPLGAAPAPSWRRGRAASPGGPRDAAPRGVAPADGPSAAAPVPRPVPGEVRPGRGAGEPRPQPGDTRGEKGRGTGTQQQQNPVPARLFTAPYGCRGRGEGHVCRAAALIMSDGVTVTAPPPAPGARGDTPLPAHAAEGPRQPRGGDSRE